MRVPDALDIASVFHELAVVVTNGEVVVYVELLYPKPVPPFMKSFVVPVPITLFILRIPTLSSDETIVWFVDAGESMR
jgi:hypothetical protein